MEEVPTRIEPCFLGDELPGDITTLAGLITDLSKEIGRGLGADIAWDLRDLVLLANAYHSNRIEGYDADPLATAVVLASDSTEHDLDDGAAALIAHVKAQREIDRRLDLDCAIHPTDTAFICAIHEALYREMPESLSSILTPQGDIRRIIPGEIRKEGNPEVVVGRHQPPSSDRVDAFMAHFGKRYRQVGPSPVARTVAIPAAHHRLSYIHPFPDGNGRTARLMTHSMARAVGISGRGLWSISRALANGMGDERAYLRMMDHADHPRMGALDGRGNLSQRALTDYSKWFLECVRAEVTFMAGLFDVESVIRRTGSANGRIAIDLAVLRFPELFDDIGGL